MELQIEDIKSTSLEVLKQIHEICVNESIKYSLAYGTLLGACRHKGFIPWDDDIDIVMLREDYDRFSEYCSCHDTPFSFKSVTTDDKYHYLFAKACNKKTIVEELYGNRNDCDLGVYVDIFPIDFIGDTEEVAIKELSKTKLLRSLLVAYNWKTYFRSNTSRWYVEPFRFLFFIISRFININNVEKKILKHYSNNTKTKYVANSVDNTYGNREIFLLDLFNDYTLIEFENFKFYSISNYDEYLRKLYGNYMELPPIEKRVTHHTFLAKWK